MADATCSACTLLSFIFSSFMTKMNNDVSVRNLMSTDLPRPSFDFIVVGAGSAGSVIANRLSENAEWNVLLLEAGCNEILFENSPVLYFTFFDGECQWKYPSVPNRNVNQGRPLVLQAGKTLGGTSSINAMIYIRGNRKDYDTWAATGAAGWDYESVLPYFKKAEDMTDRELARSKYHSTGGPLTITRLNYTTDKVVQATLRSFQENLQLPETDYNGEYQIGSAFAQFTMRDGERASTNRAYLKPVRHRKNLVVRSYSRVTRIVTDPLTKRVTGVEFLNRRGTKKFVRASKEVVVSAGAIETPRLLMLSGIGPKYHLESLGIKLIQDLPVGKKFRDHLTITPTGYPVLILVSGAKNSHRPVELSPLPFRPGQFAVAFKSFRTGDPSLPDVEFVISKILNFDGSMKMDENSPTNTVFILPVLLRPKSFGEIRLADTDPLSKPIVDAQYLSQQKDIEVLKDALKFMLRLNNSEALEEAGLRFGGVPASPCCNEGASCINDENYWDCVVRRYATSAYHPHGTCQMGSAEDKDSVVDPELRVKGIANLRVADASVLPTLSGNPNAPAIMIGEKLSEMIKDCWMSRK